HIEPLGATVEDAMASPPPSAQAHQPPPQPSQSEAPRAQDDWRQYEVRKQPTDWKNYEIPGQQPMQPPSSRRMEEMDVENALSSLKEVAGAAEGMAPRRDMGQPPAQAAQPQAPTAQHAPAAQPVNAEANPDATWSMEDLRRNLTNLSKDEKNQG
ncbi:MAG: hypothetical protein ABR899_07980, partial [Candidatus Krumholzibacteriaceae bacterium]